MSKKGVIILLLGMIGIGLAWTFYHSPPSLLKSSRGHSSPSGDTLALVLEIASFIHCPDTCCQDKEIHADQSSCQSSAQIREMIYEMVRMGLDRKQILVHLGMMGLLESLPPGHPPVGSPADTSDHPSGDPSSLELPPGHPPISN